MSNFVVLTRVLLSKLNTRGCSSNTINIQFRSQDEFIAYLAKDVKAKKGYE